MQAIITPVVMRDEHKGTEQGIPNKVPDGVERALGAQMSFPCGSGVAASLRLQQSEVETSLAKIIAAVMSEDDSFKWFKTGRFGRRKGAFCCTKSVLGARSQ